MTNRLTADRSTTELLRIALFAHVPAHTCLDLYSCWRTKWCIMGVCGCTEPRTVNISYCKGLVYGYFRHAHKERRLHLGPKSFILYKNASLAQRLEHRICNARVVGSIPTGGLSFTRLSHTVQVCVHFCLICVSVA
jgi:hypothetical protein